MLQSATCVANQSATCVTYQLAICAAYQPATCVAYQLPRTVWRVIFAGVKFGDFESKRYMKNFGVFKKLIIILIQFKFESIMTSNTTVLTI
jgi:hypothetical protein